MKRWAVSLFYRTVYFKRYYPVRLRSGEIFKVDFWHRNWRLLNKTGVHERDVEDFLAAVLEPDDIVIDVGAQIGIITSQASRMVGPYGRVISFEPDAANYEALKSLCFRNDLANVTLWNSAAGESNEKLTFRRPKGTWGAFLAGQQKGVFREHYEKSDIIEFEIDCVRLDDVTQRSSLARVDLIKIDVDGPEMLVLRGAMETLSRFRPVLIVEASRFYADYQFSLDDLFQVFRSQNYKVFYSARNAGSYKACEGPEDVEVDIGQKGNAVDFFCIPADLDGDRLRSIFEYLAIRGTEA